MRTARELVRRLITGPPPPPPPPDIRMTMGRHSYVPPEIIDYDDGEFAVTIGAFCSIALGVQLLPGGAHRTDRVSTFPFNMLLGWAEAPPDMVPPQNITIGHDVWIGRDVKILGGVTIGTGAVVGAFSVVTKDVADYEVVGGAPARHIRWRLPEPEIEAMLKIRWWDWPDDLIRSRVADMQRSADFIHKYA